jgi:putative transcriptional regulator
MNSIAGKALVASPHLMDGNFMRSVVYILRHDDEGAFGLILNRPTGMTVGEVLEQFLEHKVTSTASIYCGGPVDGPLMVLHDQPEESDFDEGLGVYITTEQKRLVAMCERNSGRYRVFDGYSGWGPEQLDDELKSGGWLIWDIEPEAIFTEPEEIWRTAIRKIGLDILGANIAPSLIPDDPALN